MPKKIRIFVNDVVLDAELNETDTAQAIWDALPIEARGNLWGDEIYFSIPVKIEPESIQDVVERGDLAYWGPGSAFCIFYGPTPASRGNEVRPASPVGVFGKIAGDYLSLKSIRSSPKVRIEKV